MLVHIAPPIFLHSVVRPNQYSSLSEPHTSEPNSGSVIYIIVSLHVAWVVTSVMMLALQVINTETKKTWVCKVSFFLEGKPVIKRHPHS